MNQHLEAALLYCTIGWLIAAAWMVGQIMILGGKG